MTSTEARLASALADRYRLERELGQGGMATVYLAEDLKHGRKVAIKVLHPELSAVIGGDRFLAEIKVTASLQHPHILGLIDSGVVSLHDPRPTTHDPSHGVASCGLYFSTNSPSRIDVTRTVPDLKYG